MPTNISEMNLEDMILAYLRDKQGYEEGTTNDYVKDYALDTERVKRFLLSTQNQITGSVLLIMFPFLGLCRRLAIHEHVWDEYQHLHDRLIKIENVLAETYFSQEQMQVFRNKVMDQMRTCHPLEEQIIRSLQSLEMMLVSDMQVHPQSFYDLVNIIREHEEVFPTWHASSTAKLYSPAIFVNKKKSGGYWF